MLVAASCRWSPILALAGSLARKQTVPPSAGTLPTDGPLFVGLLVGVVFIVGGLTFFPALALGPIVEHFLVTPASCSDDAGDQIDVTPSQRRRRRPSAVGIAQKRRRARRSASGAIVRQAALDSFRKLNPRHLLGNPVMFVVEIGARHDVLFFDELFGSRDESRQCFIGAISLWLWFTVLFANFAEAMAEGRGKAQADTLRAMKPRHDGAKRESATAAIEDVVVVGAAQGRHRARRRPATSSPATATSSRAWPT